MSTVSAPSGRFAREEDRLIELAEFSNELCEIVCTVPASVRQQSISKLLMRHKFLLTIEHEELVELLQQVQESFEKRYASLLGLDSKQSRFARNMATLVSPVKVEAVASDVNDESLPQAQPLRAAQALGMPRTQAPGAVRVRPARPRPQAQRIQLAKVSVGDESRHEEPPRAPGVSDDASEQMFDVRVRELSVALENEDRGDKLLKRALLLMSEGLRVPQLLVLKANASRSELTLCGGLRDDLEGLTKEFRVPLMPARAATDIFSLAYHQNKDIQVCDTFSDKALTTVPRRYYETLGSSALALLPCSYKGLPTVLVLVDVESPGQLPSSKRIESVAQLRPILVRAIP